MWWSFFLGIAAVISISVGYATSSAHSTQHCWHCTTIVNRHIHCCLTLWPLRTVVTGTISANPTPKEHISPESDTGCCHCGQWTYNCVERWSMCCRDSFLFSLNWRSQHHKYWRHNCKNTSSLCTTRIHSNKGRILSLCTVWILNRDWTMSYKSFGPCYARTHTRLANVLKFSRKLPIQCTKAPSLSLFWKLSPTTAMPN